MTFLCFPGHWKYAATFGKINAGFLFRYKINYVYLPICVIVNLIIINYVEYI